MRAGLPSHCPRGTLSKLLPVAAALPQLAAWERYAYSDQGLLSNWGILRKQNRIQFPQAKTEIVS